MTIDRQDLGAGTVFIGTGLLYGSVALYGGLANPQLPIGQALNMGPGYFPVVLSVLLLIVGGILVLRSFFAAQALDFFVISWRAIFMLSLAVIIFGAFVRNMGLALAVFVVTFFSALASRHVTLAYAAATALGMTILCIAVFSYGVRLPIPVVGTWFVK